MVPPMGGGGGATHDYYLRRAAPSGFIEVDHLFECQWLAHAIVQTDECHAALAQFASGETRTNQPQVVRSLLDPLYTLQNDAESCINLRLLDKSTNGLKGHAASNFLHTLAARHEGGFVPLLEHQLSNSRAVNDGLVGADALARRFERELLGLEDAFVARVEAAPVPASVTGLAERRKAAERFAAVGASVRALFEEMELRSAH